MRTDHVRLDGVGVANRLDPRADLEHRRAGTGLYLGWPDVACRVPCLVPSRQRPREDSGLGPRRTRTHGLSASVPQQAAEGNRCRRATAARFDIGVAGDGDGRRQSPLEPEPADVARRRRPAAWSARRGRSESQRRLRTAAGRSLLNDDAAFGNGGRFLFECQTKHEPAPPVGIRMSFSAMRIGWSIALAAVVAAGPGRTSDGAELPLDFFATHCQDCHGVAEANAELRLDEVDGWDLTSAADQQRLERVLQAIKEGAMTPETSGALSAETRNGAVDALHAVLMEVSAERPRRLRRLSRREYRQTIRDLFGFEFELPVGFPADSISHRFDNLAEGLTMSGPLMKGYFDAAIAIADRMVPPPGKPVEAKRTELAASDLVISYSSGAIIDGAMRLAARTDSMWRSCTWPEAFEVQTAGTYRISVSASRFAPRSQAWDEPLSPMQLQVRARSLNGKDGDAITKQRLLAEFAVSEAEPQRFQKVVELQPAETPVFHFANALLDGDRGDRKAFADLLRTMFANDPRLLAGWLQVEHGSGLRGGIGWDRVKALRDDPDLELDEVDRSDKAVNKLVKKMTGNPGLYAETVVYQLFEEGPALEIHDVQIEGPLAVLPTEKEKRQAALTRQFLGTPGKRSTEQYAGDFLERFLTKAFRRPVRPAEHQQYLDLLMGEVAQGRGLKAGAHLAIRTALMSPAFLYRGDQAGRLDEHGLATRLAYFLHGGPPDEPLREAARRGKLSQPDGLRSQAKRMLAAPSADRFASDFSR